MQILFGEIVRINHGMQPKNTGFFVTQIAAVLIAVQMVAAELACQDSGYCSLGLLTPFVGDLYPSNHLRGH